MLREIHKVIQMYFARGTKEAQSFTIQVDLLVSWFEHQLDAFMGWAILVSINGSNILGFLFSYQQLRLVFYPKINCFFVQISNKLI